MVYIPYRTTFTAGDETRVPNLICQVGLGQVVNFMERTYAEHTGYTMQKYKSSNTVTPQTNVFIRTKNRNKPTPKTLDGSNKPKSSVNLVY